MPRTWYVAGRVYQKVRDPESLLIETHAKAHAEAGYPLPELDSAMNAEDVLLEAKSAVGKGEPHKDPMA
jgi:hypothetical protein